MAEQSEQPQPPEVPPPTETTSASDQPVAQSSFGGWMGSMWLYTTLRFALFGALWGALYLVGVSGYISALIGLVLSVPLSFVLLARPRARFAGQIEARVNSRRVERTELDAQLDPEAEQRDADLRAAEAEEARHIAMLKKSRRKGSAA